MFLLFAGYNYYPEGGWHDYVGSFATIESAMEHVITLKSDWYHIVSGGVIVKNSRSY